MKGTQTDIVLPSFFQMNMGGDHVHDIRIREDLVHNLLRVIPPEYFSSLKAGTLRKPCPPGNTGYAGSFLSGFHPQPCPSGNYSTDHALGTKSSSYFAIAK